MNPLRAASLRRAGLSPCLSFSRAGVPRPHVRVSPMLIHIPSAIEAEASSQQGLSPCTPPRAAPHVSPFARRGPWRSNSTSSAPPPPPSRAPPPGPNHRFKTRQEVYAARNRTLLMYTTAVVRSLLLPTTPPYSSGRSKSARRPDYRRHWRNVRGGPALPHVLCRDRLRGHPQGRHGQV